MLKPLNTDNWNDVLTSCSAFLRQTKEPTSNRREDGQSKCLGGIYEYLDHTFEITPRFGKSYNVVGFLVKLNGVDIPADRNLHPRRFAYYTSVKRARIAVFRKLYNL